MGVLFGRVFFFWGVAHFCLRDLKNICIPWIFIHCTKNTNIFFNKKSKKNMLLQKLGINKIICWPKTPKLACHWDRSLAPLHHCSIGNPDCTVHRPRNIDQACRSCKCKNAARKRTNGAKRPCPKRVFNGIDGRPRRLLLIQTLEITVSQPISWIRRHAQKSHFAPAISEHFTSVFHFPLQKPQCTTWRKSQWRSLWHWNHLQRRRSGPRGLAEGTT